MFEPIFSSYLDTNILSCNLKEIKKDILNLKKNSKGVIISNRGGWQSESTNKIRSSCEELFYQINILVANVAKNLDLSKKVTLANYWFNVNNLSDFNVPHSHISGSNNPSRNLITGVFYVDVPKNSGDLIFLNEDKTVPTVYDLNVNSYNTYTSAVWTLHPVNNLCVLFPANLTHYVEPNLSKKNRISISFNYDF